MNPALHFKFRLYVAGSAPNSTQAIINLGAMCRAHLMNRHEIDIVDVFAEPHRALSDGIFMTPTLLKLEPEPARRIVGTLSNARTVTLALGLDERASP